MWNEFSNFLSGLFGNSEGGTPETERPAYTGGNYYSAPASGIGSALGAKVYQKPDTPFWSMKAAFGDGENGGWSMPIVQGFQSLANWSQGNKALALARDQFNFSKDITQKNLANQTSLLNTAMQDRQNARRSSSSSYQDTGSYMNERGL